MFLSFLEAAFVEISSPQSYTRLVRRPTGHPSPQSGETSSKQQRCYRVLPQDEDKGYDKRKLKGWLVPGERDNVVKMEGGRGGWGYFVTKGCRAS